MKFELNAYQRDVLLTLLQRAKDECSKSLLFLRQSESGKDVQDPLAVWRFRGSIEAYVEIEEALKHGS